MGSGKKGRCANQRKMMGIKEVCYYISIFQSGLSFFILAPKPELPEAIACCFCGDRDATKKRKENKYISPKKQKTS